MLSIIIPNSLQGFKQQFIDRAAERHRQNGRNSIFVSKIYKFIGLDFYNFSVIYSVYFTHNRYKILR